MKWMSFIHLKVITKLLTKKRINNCNQQQSQTFKKERMIMTNKTILTMKRRKQTINGKRNLQNKKI